MKKKLLISFSGGRTSAYMLWWLMNEWPDRHNWEIVVVFANTGLEASETLVFTHKCAIEWGIKVVWVEARHRDDNGVPFSEKGWQVSHQVVDYFTASRGQEKVDGTFEWTPFEEMISILGIPNINAPFCSPQLKRLPIESYMKSIGWTDYYKAIGLRIDEIDRVNENYKDKKVIYPLIGHKKELDCYNPSKKTDIVLWWQKQKFDLEVHDDEGNCVGCWKKSMERLTRIGKRNPRAFRWWQYITDKYGSYNPRGGVVNIGDGMNFYRGNLSPKDILKLSDMQLEQLQLFAEDNRLNSCSESCEAF